MSFKTSKKIMADNAVISAGLAAMLLASTLPAFPMAGVASALSLNYVQQELKSEQIAEPATDESISSPSSEAPVVVPADGQAVGRVAAQYKLNVRRCPGGEIIGGLQPGTLVMVLAREGEWYKIRFDGSYAYVHDSLISIESGNPRVVGPWIKVPAAGTVIAKYKLNVRKSPWGEIIDGYKPGTQVEIIGCEGEWYKIRHGDGVAFVHCEMIKVDAPPSAGIQSEREERRESSNRADSSDATSPRNSAQISTQPGTAGTPAAQGGINGPAIPAELKRGLEAAKRSKWMTSHKCLQFAGTVAHEAGAPEGKSNYTQAQSNWPADTALRGTSINELPAAIESGGLLPGMLVHVKIHYDKDPAYHVSNDAHHWFVYMGKDEQGVPRFADNTHKGNLQTADDVYKNMKGWDNSRKYGDSRYGYIPRVTAVHDPFAGQR